MCTLVALGLAPGPGDPAATAVSLTESEGPRPRGLVDDFLFANALRAGVAAGGGPVILVHLAAIAREAGVAGFDQMMRVPRCETPKSTLNGYRSTAYPPPLFPERHLHDVPTVAGNLKKTCRQRLLAGEHSRLVFVRARASGAEAVCRVRKGVTEPAGECRVFGSEEEAVGA